MRGFNQIVVKQLASCDKFLFHLETIFKWLGFFLKSQNTVEEMYIYCLDDQDKWIMVFETYTLAPISERKSKC